MNYQPPCPEWTEKLALRLEDLSPSERVELDEHIRTCPGCSATRSEYSKLITRLQTLTSPAMVKEVEFAVQNASQVGSSATLTSKQAPNQYSSWKEISNIYDKTCKICGFIGNANALYCGSCGFPLHAGTGKMPMEFPSNTSGGALPIFRVAPVQSFWIQRKIIIFSITVILLLLVIGTGLFALAYQLGSNSIQAGSSGPLPANNAATTPTVGTTTPTPTPDSTSTTAPKAGTILYQEDGSDGWQGWALTTDWKIVENNKLLIDDGSVGRNHQGPSAIPPFTLPSGVQNFAIEATITLPQIPSDAHFGMSACGSTTASGWQGYEGIIAFGYAGGNPTAQVLRYSDAQLANVAFDPGTRSHTYRLEVRGNIINLFIDHARVIQATDNKFLTCGSQVGMWSSAAIIQVRSFKVIAL